MCTLCCVCCVCTSHAAYPTTFYITDIHHVACATVKCMCLCGCTACMCLYLCLYLCLRRCVCVCGVVSPPVCRGACTNCLRCLLQIFEPITCVFDLCMSVRVYGWCMFVYACAVDRSVKTRPFPHMSSTLCVTVRVCVYVKVCVCVYL